jgi:hypothetical protein
MLTNLIYAMPSWAMMALVVGVVVILSLLGLAAASRLIPPEMRRRHNEFVGFNSALVGVFFAVLLAFIAVAAWESFGKAGETAATEASLAGDLFRDAHAMPEPLKSKLTDEIRDYVQIVLAKEWPAMARGEEFGDEGWKPLMDFHATLVSAAPGDAIATAMVSEALRRLNSLYDARRERLLAATDHIEGMVWWVVLIGSAITIGFTFLFGMDDLRMHMAMTGAVAASLALVMVLILSFDYPFRGQVQIRPDGFEHVKHNMESVGIRFLE